MLACFSLGQRTSHLGLFCLAWYGFVERPRSASDGDTLGVQAVTIATRSTSYCDDRRRRAGAGHATAVAGSPQGLARADTADDRTLNAATPEARVVRTLVHLSDLHFGRIDAAVLAPLVTTVTALTPDVVIVSGDLTQRARTHEFHAARVFLDALPTPQIIVPGNHDVPLYNPVGRFVHRLRKYQRFITPDLEPFYADAQIAILGLNTARSLVFKGGRLNVHQIARMRARLCEGLPDVVKILVTHHPFEVPAGYNERDVVGRARLAMQMLATCGVDLLLSGHLHRSYLGQTAARYPLGGYTALVIQAGTATSTRGRGEANAFNVIRIARPSLTVDQVRWHPAAGAFVPAATERFHQTPQGWMPSAKASGPSGG
jgi:predicted MPP superfamily phosphohydrolase